MNDYFARLEAADRAVYDAVKGEEARQRAGVELVPSENYTYPEVLATLGSVLTNKYSEGYPGRRYYGGQQYTDAVETLACERARQLFHCEHANVQPLSGAAMNQAVYHAFLKPGDVVVGMDLSHGGHLTHGAPVSHMGRIFNFVRYKTVPEEQGRIDFDLLRKIVRDSRPKILLCGYSSYPRDLDYSAFKKIADEAGALTMADVSHIGGLIAGGALNNPFAANFDIVTTTTHKSLRGPRGGMILCRAPFAKAIDASVFPGLQGGPHMNAVAGIAVTLGKALQPEFRIYAQQVLANAKAFAQALMEQGMRLVTGGTDNHMLVVDTVKSLGMDGRAAEQTLDKISITVNKQVIPDDPNPPLRPSGIRMGTPAATTRGMREQDMRLLAGWIVEALRESGDEERLRTLRKEVEAFCSRFAVPGLQGG